MNFGLCFSWNVGTQLMNWRWSSVFGILFYCENENEAKRSVMRLVVDGDKYLQGQKAEYS
jgi:hypothetical protein